MLRLGSSASFLKIMSKTYCDYFVNILDQQKYVVCLVKDVHQRNIDWAAVERNQAASLLKYAGLKSWLLCSSLTKSFRECFTWSLIESWFSTGISEIAGCSTKKTTIWVKIHCHQCESLICHKSNAKSVPWHGKGLKILASTELCYVCIVWMHN